MERHTERHDCVVIGGGLSGLAAALRLAASGRSVVVLEQGGELGGRARSTEVAGVPVDLGFQSIFTAYDATSRFLADIGMRGRDLVPFARGAVFHEGIDWQRLQLTPRSLRRFQAFTSGDVVRLARLAAEVRTHSCQSLLRSDAQDETMEEHLRRRGFTGGAIEGFFRPLFGVITLDRALQSDAGYFRFLMRMLVDGRAAVPVEGHGMIARWAGAAIRQRGGVVRTGAEVTEIVLGPDGRAEGVALAGGGVVRGAHVIVAVEAPAARSLLAPVDRVCADRLAVPAAGVTTLVYALGRSFHRGRTIVLNAVPGDVRPRVDLVCQESNVTRPEADGPHVLLATSVHEGAEAPDVTALEGEMARMAGRWNPGFDWGRHARLTEVVVHPFAQFRVPPGARRDLPGPRTRVGNVVLAGDVTHHPSIEGAVLSGNTAADIVSELLS